MRVQLTRLHDKFSYLRLGITMDWLFALHDLYKRNTRIPHPAADALAIRIRATADVSGEAFTQYGLDPKTETRLAATLHSKEPREWRISQMTRNPRRVRHKREPYEDLAAVHRLVNTL